jgi:CheY-like chemotaxis protein
MKRAAILVVEDEPLVRMHAADFLAESGYHVIEAANADEAIAILEHHPDIAIVFTDVNMPGSMDGLKLVQTVRKRWPPVLLIVTSGKNALSDKSLPAGGRFIPKPYTSKQVIDVVHQLAA